MIGGKTKAKASGKSIAAARDVNISGYSIKQHERALNKRVKEVRRDLKQAHDAEKALLEKELADIGDKLARLEESHAERVTELERVQTELSDYTGELPEARLKQAENALAKGDTSLADSIFAQVADMEQPSIARAAQAHFRRGHIAYDDIRWADARRLFVRAVQLAPENEDYVHWAARLHELSGDYPAAEPLYEKAVKIAGETHGKDSVGHAAALNNLALLYKEQGHYEDAEPLYKKAIAIGEKTLPAVHPDLAKGYNNLAGLYQAQGRYEDAEPLYNKAIAIGEKALPADHPDLARWYNNLALLYQAQGRYEDAEPLYKKAIAIGEKALPADHPDLATWYNNLAGVYFDQERYEEAELLFIKALDIVTKKLGKSHPNTRLCANNFAGLLQVMDRPAAAEALRKKYGL